MARFKEMYGLKGLDYISKELNRPISSIEKMAETIFPPITRTGPWTASELQRMKQYLGICEVDIIARIFGRGIADIEAQIQKLGKIQTDAPWTQEEVVVFKRMYGTRTDEDIARVFSRSVVVVQEKAEELCLAKDKAFVRKISGEDTITKMPRWSAEEIEKLTEMYADNSNLEIAQALNRSVKSVVSKAHNIGLKKDPNRLQEMGRQNVSLRYNRQTAIASYQGEESPNQALAAGEARSTVAGGEARRDLKNGKRGIQQADPSSSFVREDDSPESDED